MTNLRGRSRRQKDAFYFGKQIRIRRLRKGYRHTAAVYNVMLFQMIALHIICPTSLGAAVAGVGGSIPGP